MGGRRVAFTILLTLGQVLGQYSAYSSSSTASSLSSSPASAAGASGYRTSGGGSSYGNSNGGSSSFGSNSGSAYSQNSQTGSSFGVSDGMSSSSFNGYSGDAFRRGLQATYGGSSSPYGTSYGSSGFARTAIPYGGPPAGFSSYGMRNSYGPLLDTGSYGVPPGFLSGSGAVYRFPSSLGFGYGNGMAPYGSFGPFSPSEFGGIYGGNQYAPGFGDGFGLFGDPQVIGGVRTSQTRQKESRMRSGGR